MKSKEQIEHEYRIQKSVVTGLEKNDPYQSLEEELGALRALEWVLDYE